MFTRSRYPVLVVILCLIAMSRLPTFAATESTVPVQTTTLQVRSESTGRLIPIELWLPSGSGRFPLLLFFPGWGAAVHDNGKLLHSLAEHGFVVAGVSYPTGPNLPDPKVAMQFAPEAAYHAGLEQGNRMVHLQAEDASEVMTHLLKADTAGSGPLLHHLKVGMIGVLGYSLGGAVAAQTSLDDPRVRAVMNLDGWMFGDPVAKKFGQPYLVISDGLPQPTTAEIQAPDTFLRNFSSLRVSDRKIQNAQLSHSRGYRITVAGSNHFTFSEKTVAKPGEIDPSRATEITAAYAAAFFTKELKHAPAPLLDTGETRFVEAHLETFPK